jgi:hypothetical protein
MRLSLLSLKIYLALWNFNCLVMSSNLKVEKSVHLLDVMFFLHF